MNNCAPQRDPCEHISELNLDLEADCIDILLRDKHGRLEGICAEILFERELIAPAFADYSTGWWVARQNGAYRIAHMTERGHKVSILDTEIYSLFLSNNVSVVRLEFDSEERILRRHTISKDVEAGSIAISNPRTQQTAENPLRMAKPTERDPARSEKAIKFLKSANAIRTSAISRLIANCFVHSSYLWDVDAIVRHDDKLIAFETKQKFPSRKGKFGINVGLSGVFSFLERCGLRVIHVVLTKPIWETDVSAIDLISDPIYAGKSIWIATESNNIGRSGNQTDAPARTSINGEHSLVTNDIEITDFHQISVQGNPSTGLLEYLSDKTSKLRGIQDIPHIQPDIPW